ncbi:hypothetical protein NT6N_17240 [Oceaniferula spumae]|uniref:PPIase cyclophilin-type domain-containing protein n=1 Tax=Oceaniferula spumae TaxID=2979115 RepID=A0AAT9FKZ0_9BACT
MSRRLLKFVTILVGLTGLVRAQEADGLLADIVTSTGQNFTIELRYDAAPRTVAHFMRLASGDQPWLDHATGNVVNEVPYFTGSKFQKFLSQSGPNRAYLQFGERKDLFGTEGPGYVLRDEIRRYGNGSGALILPHAAYTVTMANNGPHSSGGRIIITLVNDPQFDDVNSAFGTVRQQYYTYNSQGQPTGVTNGRIAVDNIFGSFGQVSITSISIRRRGVGANAFDETQHWGELPTMGKVPITSVTHTPTNVILHHDSQAGGVYRSYASPDLFNWYYAPSFDVYHGVGVGPSSPMSLTHGGSPRGFYRLTGVFYPVTTAPQNLYDSSISVGVGTVDNVRFDFDASGTQSIYTFPNGDWGELIYDYTVTGPYTAELHVTTPGLAETTYTLYFGGKNLNVSTTERMSAKIKYAGQDEKDSFFTIGPSAL